MPPQKRRATNSHAVARSAEGKRPREEDLSELQASLPLDPVNGCHFPMYVMAKQSFLKLERLLSHEDAKERGLLVTLAPDDRDGTYNPFFKLLCDAAGRPLEAAVEFFKLCFFSHTWLSPSRAVGVRLPRGYAHALFDAGSRSGVCAFCMYTAASLVRHMLASTVH